MARRQLPLIGGPVRFGGAVEVLEQFGGVVPMRLPANDMAVLPGFLVGAAMTCGGVRIELESDATTLHVRGQQLPLLGAPPAYDLVVDRTLVETRRAPSAGPFVMKFALRPGWKVIELWLPTGTMVCVDSISVEVGAAAKQADALGPRWLAYGSSITQSIDADHPVRAWPVMLARQYGLCLVSLGFAGNCHLEPQVARAIRDDPAELILLELGINVVEQGSYSFRTFSPALLGFIQTIRERHVETPILVTSPIFQGELDKVEGPTGMTLPSVRVAIGAAVDTLRAMGAGNVHYLDGTSLLGPDDVGALRRRHPTDEGNRRIAERLASEAFGADGVFGERLGAGPERPVPAAPAGGTGRSRPSRRVLGLAFTGHGASICLVEDGAIRRAVNLERLTRTKASLCGLPHHRRVLVAVRSTGLTDGRPPEYFDFYEVFPDMLEYVSGHRTLQAAGIDLVVKTRDNIRPVGGGSDTGYADFLSYFGATSLEPDLEHHLAHAYQAYLCSPFDEAAVLTVDGTGERLARNRDLPITCTLSRGWKQRIDVLSEVLAPNSVGGLYAAFTKHLGFGHDQEGNTMALASFGRDALPPEIRTRAVELLADGTFRLGTDARGISLVADLKEAVARRERGGPIERVHEDWAWVAQAVTEDILVNAARALVERTGYRRLAVAGGVSLNCVANAKVLAEADLEELYVMPNAGDRGLAVGCALYGYHVVLGGTERSPPRHDYLGRSYAEREVLHAVSQVAGVSARRSDNIAREVATRIAGGQIVGWHQGGAEFGPRALGHRSILADPRTLDSKRRLDDEIKRREWFRPYCPSVLKERASDYFEVSGDAPYMLLAVRARPARAAAIAGVVHVDGTARIQTVDRAVEPLYHRLISEFDRLTGVPMLLNTSFNGYGQPIVESPADALEAFESMGLDALAIGDFVIERRLPDPS